MTITWQTIITFAAVITAIITIFKQYNRGYDMVKHQAEQDKAIDELRQQIKTDRAESNEELQLLTYGVLACLKGLKEQGCNGPVSEAIMKFEKHLNDKAHS